MKKIVASICVCLSLLLFAAPVCAAPEEDFSPVWPAQGCYFVMSLDYYYSSGSAHSPMKAVDIAKSGTADVNILAAADGTVTTVVNNNSPISYGNYIIIQHDSTHFTRYAHLKESSITVAVGDTVKAGQKIALMGSTGNSTGTHLHFEIGSTPRMGSLEYALDYFLDDSAVYSKLAFAKGLANVSVRYGKFIQNGYPKLAGSFYYYGGKGLDLSLIGAAVTPTPDPTPEPDPAPKPDPTPTPEPDPAPEPDPTPEPDPVPTPEPDNNGVMVSTVSSSEVRAALAATASGEYSVIDKGTPTSSSRQYVVAYAALTAIRSNNAMAGLILKDSLGSFTMNRDYILGLISHANKSGITFVMEKTAGGESSATYNMVIKNDAGKVITSGGLGRCLVEGAYTAAGNGATLAIRYGDAPVAQCGYLSDGAVMRWVFGESGKYTLLDNPKSFTDLGKAAWAKKYIDPLAAKGVINGKTATTFDPLGKITRAEFVKILAVISGDDLSLFADAGFSDVPQGKWYRSYVNWAVDIGIAGGTGATTFSPERAITRQEMAAIIYKFATYLGSSLPAVRDGITFSDADRIASWAKEACDSLYKAGVINGANGAFKPTDSATRAEAASIAYNLVAGLITNL